MDTNPMQMPNTAYINGLNVTLITKDGNEHILQNDMGNGRVETAYLPEGYIPLGTCSLGGIIYVASYNPLKDKGQIGCFPSPERNISSDEDSELNVELTNNDFQFKPDETNGSTSSEGAQTYYLKKQLWADRQFNPGDKFIVYGSSISGNFEKLWIEREYIDLLNYVKDENPDWKPNLKEEETEPGPEVNPTADTDEGDDEEGTGDEEEKKRKLEWANSIWDLIKKHTVNLSIGTITNTGKLIVFSNLKEYSINDQKGKDPLLKDIDGNPYGYLIFEYKDQNNPQKTDLDDYRSLVSQPYNVFNSKISGQLVLIAELVQFDDFDMTIKNNMGVDEAGHKTYEPVFSFNYEGDYPYIPYGAECTFQMTWKDGPTVEDKKEDEDYSGESEEEHADYLCHDHDSDLKSDFCEYKGLKYDGYKLDNPFPVKYVQDESGNQTENDKSIHYLLNKWSSTGFFDNKERNSGGKIRYEIKPSMIWGPVTYLKVDGLIDLDKIGTGYIGITQWRYYNDDNKCTLNWGLETYEEDGYQVSSIVMRMSRLTGYNRRSGYSVEMIDYFVDTNDSYFGTFTEQIPLDSEYFKIKQITGFNNMDPDDDKSDKDPDNPIYGEKYFTLKSNQLYLVDIRVAYDKINSEDGEEDNSTVRHFYRWLFTNPVLNEYYGRSQDFCKEYLTFNIDFSTSVVNSFYETENSGVHYGHIFDKTDSGDEYASKESSFSVYQHDYNVETTAEILVKLTSDYNIFYLDVSNSNDKTFTVTVEDGNVDVSDIVQSSYLGSDDEERTGLLTNSAEKTDDISQYYYEKHNGDIFSIPSTVFSLDGKNIDTTCKDSSDNTTNTITINIDGELLQTIRAYCTKMVKTINVNGLFRPLAYDEYTFSKYGLEWSYFDCSGVNPSNINGVVYENSKGVTGPKMQETNQTRWNVKKIGVWGMRERGGQSGHSYVAAAGRNDSYSDQNRMEIEKQETIGFHFQSREKVAEAWKAYGITYPISFLLYYYGVSHSHDNDTDTLSIKGADVNNKLVDDEPVYIGCARHYNHNRFGLFFAMRDETGSYYQIPLNLFQCISFTDRPQKHSFDTATYPGCFSYFGLPHIIAQWLNNIYMYDASGTTFDAYVPNGIYWEDEYVSNISIPVVIEINSDTLNEKTVQIKLDDGTLIDLREIKEVYTGTEDTDTEKINPLTFDGVQLVDIDELEKEDWKEDIKDKNGEKIGEKTIQILDPNMQYTIKSDDQYNTIIDIVKSDTTSGDIMRDEMVSMQNAVLDGAIYDYDGTLLTDNCDVKIDKTCLYMRNDIDENTFSVKLADDFIPYKMSYENNNTFKNNGINKKEKLDDSIITGINLNSYFVINDDLIYLKEDHTGWQGDISIDIKRKDDDDGAYVDGIVDIPILPVYSYKSSL